MRGLDKGIFRNILRVLKIIGYISCCTIWLAFAVITYIHRNDVGPTEPAEVEAALKQEVANFHVMPESWLMSYPSTRKSTAVYMQAVIKKNRPDNEVRKFYFDEAQRNGWILVDEKTQTGEVTFHKFGAHKRPYHLTINYGRTYDIVLNLSWRG